MTIECPVRTTARTHPDAVLIADADGLLRYGEADALLDEMGSRLSAHGIVPGDRLAIHARPSRSYVLLLLACWRAGIVACPLNLRRPAASLEAYRAVLAVRSAVSDDEAAAENRAIPISGLVQANQAETPSPALIDFERIALIIATSGSLGEPRAVALSYRSLYRNAAGSNENLALEPGDGWLLSLPLYHVGGIGIVMRCVIASAAIVIPGESVGDTNSPPYPITHVSFVPTQLQRLLEGRLELPSHVFKAVLLGGAPAPPRLVAEALAQRLPVYRSYGLTEMGSQVTTTRPDADARELETSGRLLPHRELRISERGEIQVRGATLFSGYVEGGGLHLPLDEDGWFCTGDRGELDETGNLRVRGRFDNRFISGGENIQPEEIERALLGLPGVEEAVVVPVPDDEFGERPVAFIRTREAAVDLPVLRAQLRTALPGYMVPRELYAWPSELEVGLKPARKQLLVLAIERQDRT